MRTGIFVGSFDPYTIGHASVVRRALDLFDSVVIGVGVNSQKHYVHTAEERVEAIRQLYSDEPRVSVMSYSDLTVEFAWRMKAQFIIKGVRTVQDFEYERQQADINRRLTGLETVAFFAEPGLDCINSGIVRELDNYGWDTSEFLP